MKLFIAAMKKAINEDCKLCDELEVKIEGLNFYRVPKNMLFVDDYVFYAKKNYFEKASRVEMWGGTGLARTPIEKINKAYPGDDLFSKFEIMHLVTFQMQKTLLPSCLVVYDDDTFELHTFGFSIKTTVYRKFNEIARRIDVDRITQVLFVTEMYAYDTKDIDNMDSLERFKHGRNEILAFYMVGKDLAMKAHRFDTKQIDNLKYIGSVMFAKPTKPEFPRFMYPILQQFMRMQ